MKYLLFFIIAVAMVMTRCTNTTQNKAISGDRLLADPEHEIKDSPEIMGHDSTILYTGWYYVSDSVTGYKRELDRSIETYYIDRQPIVTAKNFTTLEIYERDEGDQKYVALSMKLNDKGTGQWSIATKKSIGKKVAFILDNKLLYVTEVMSQITNGVTALNRESYSRGELENLKTIIESEE